MGIEELKGSFNAFQDLYKQKYGKAANADELVEYARSQNTNIFAVWDTLFDENDKVGDTMNIENYYAEGDNLLFQSDDGKIMAFNIVDGTVKEATNLDMAKMLDMLDDDQVNGSITAGMVDNSRMDLGRDSIKFFESLDLLDANIETEDNANSTIKISSEDSLKLLTDMAEAAGLDNIHELALKVQNDPNFAKTVQNEIAEYLKNLFGGGDVKAALMKLADVNQLPQSQDAINAAFGKAVEATFAQIMSSFNDESKTNHNIEFILGDIKSVDVNFAAVKNDLNNQIAAEAEAARRAAEAARLNAARNGNFTQVTNQELQAMWDRGERPSGIGDEIHRRHASGATWMHDPMGFNANGLRFDFIEDENNDGKFNGMEEFVGFDKDWADLTKYDTNNDGHITNEELKQLQVLVTDEKAGKAYVADAASIGIDNIDLTSYEKRNEVNQDGNILAGLFDVEFNDKQVKAEQTYDTEEFLKKKYGDYYGLDMA